MKYICKTPVIILIYKRPDLTAKLIDSLRKVKPKKIFVVADGPKTKEDATLVNETRGAISTIDWQCDLKTNYSNTNLGLRKRVSTGITWAFKYTDRAIILEDDCIADPTFFKYVDELLNKYENDERIMAISGDNYQDGIKRTEASYYFSKYPHCWGWATWKRAWSLYDDKMTDWPEIKKQNVLKNILPNKISRMFWEFTFDKLYKNEINSWAYRWQYSCWINSGLTILPNKNLVTNIGDDRRATNTKFSKTAIKSHQLKFPLIHPEIMVVDHEADYYTEMHRFLSPLSIGGLVYRSLLHSLKAI